jgi:transmembrane sensor
MDSPKTGLMVLGERIQAALEVETRPAEVLREVQLRLLEHVTDTRHKARAPSFWQARSAALAALGLLALGALVFEAWPRPISFVTSSGERDAGDVLSASEHAPLRIDFSEGSLMVLHEGSSARVLETQPAGARVLLENGVADVSVVHQQGRAAHWRFEAGPFQVLVKGTQFELAWQPAQEALSLTMKEGSVELSGSCLAKPQLVARGSSVRVSCAKAAPAPAQAPSTAHETPRTSTTAEPSKPERTAEPRSFEASCESAAKAELVAWANRERLAGSLARARTALLALRRRFPESREAGTAAFTLGRMAFDQRANFAEAARWFASYLAEQPDGPLMGDAAGRLLEAHERLGDRASARRDAESYLRRFPDGPYASRARRILAE